MKNCKNCNTVLNDDAKFCPTCGAEQEIIEPQAAQPFADAQPQQPFAGAQAQPENSAPVNTYFTPGTNAQPASFNGGAVVENVGAPKKKKGVKIVLAVVAIFVICFVAGMVKGFLTADNDKASNPSAGTSQSENGGSIFDKGTSDETGYTNSSLGLKINCPENWNVLTGDNMSEFLELAPDENGKFVDYDGTVFEFSAMNVRSGSNIIVYSIEGNFADALLSEDDFIEEFVDEYKQDGDMVGDPFKILIGGTSYSCFDIESVSVQGIINQRMMVAKEGKEYVYILLSVSPDDDETIDALIQNYFTEAN